MSRLQFLLVLAVFFLPIGGQLFGQQSSDNPPPQEDAVASQGSQSQSDETADGDSDAERVEGETESDEAESENVKGGSDASASKEPAAEVRPNGNGRRKRIIGSTALIQEAVSGFVFTARVDTGAKSCSLHVEDVKIEGEADRMLDNIGKTIRFLLRDENDKTLYISTKIKKVVRIRNASGVERRYKVPLTLIWKDMKKEVLVTLNDRGKMEFPLLIGRNFLKDDFLVDVNLNSTD